MDNEEGPTLIPEEQLFFIVHLGDGLLNPVTMVTNALRSTCSPFNGLVRAGQCQLS